MSQRGNLPGSLLDIYTDAQAEQIGKGLTVEQEDSVFGRRIFKLLKNSGAAAITATTTKGMAAALTDLDGFSVAAGSVLGAVFGGLRVAAFQGGTKQAPTDLPQDYWGWFLVLGHVNGMLGDGAAALVAGDPIILDDDSDVGRVGGMTAPLTTITHVAPGTPDYAIQTMTSGQFGFVTADEGNTVMSVIRNLQIRDGQAQNAFARAVANSAGVADEAVSMYVNNNPWGAY